jgi:hypothetical protein
MLVFDWRHSSSSGEAVASESEVVLVLSSCLLETLIKDSSSLSSFLMLDGRRIFDSCENKEVRVYVWRNAAAVVLSSAGAVVLSSAGAVVLSSAGAVVLSSAGASSTGSVMLAEAS